MKLKLKFPFKKRGISAEGLAHFSALMFFCNPLLERLFRILLRSVSMQPSAIPLTILLVYFPLLLACLMDWQRFVKLDFIAILSAAVLIFALSLAFHPEYDYWYARSDYGVWNYVLLPLNGLYFYLFARLYDDPGELKKTLKTASWLMYLYFFYIAITASNRGFWYGVLGQNGKAEFSYSVSFGYHVLLFMLPFLYDAIKNKKLADILGAFIGAVFILFYGSRGPILMVVLFLVFMILRSFRKQEALYKKVLRVFGILILLGIMVGLTEDVFNALSAMLSQIGISSRLIAKYLSDELTSDSGRSVIWNAALEMIRENPFGYGAMGSQPVISHYIIAGYPHNILLELMIDYGVILGGALFLFLLIKALRIMFDRESEWCALFVPAFCAACGLFISLCYWSNRAFWLSLGIGVNYYISRKRKKQEVPIHGNVQDS